MNPKITGTTLPVLEIGLESGDVIIAEPGEFSWMTENVSLKTTTMTAGAKGILGALGRALSGGGLFMTEYSVGSGNGLIAFSAKVPGQIVEVDVQPGHGFMIHRDGFLCATAGVELAIGFQKSLGAGIFGGNGFVLQQHRGTCTAWVELGGEVVIYDLQPGESLQVHPGHIGMFEETINFDMRFMPGITNALFGSNGLFIAHLTGPGKVWLQTLTLSDLAQALLPYLGNEMATQSTQAGLTGGVAGAAAGAAIREMFGGSS